MVSGTVIAATRLSPLPAADHRPDQDCGTDLEQALELDHEQRRNKGYGHADGGEGVAGAGRLGFAQAADADDEQSGSREVGQEGSYLQGISSLSF
jgi:hypothetical protein